MQTRLFIGGAFVDGADGTTVEVLDPHDCSVLAEVAEARAADVDRAVAAATDAFPAWAATPAAERGRMLLRLADAIEAHADELARLESTNTGHPRRDSAGLDVPRTAATFRYFGGIADKVEGTVVPVERGFLNYVDREPLGVVGQIVPWNFPLMFCGWKLGPALAAGNTAVLKPSELTPLTSLRLAELLVEVGLPPGVVNIVPGYGQTAGQHLAEHPGVAKIAFTGSTAVGRRIVEASSGNLKRVQLELGGKGANVVFADADLDLARNGSAFAIFHNQGQACIAGSRLLLHEDIADAFLDGFVELARSIRLGHPLAPGTEMGPLTSPIHRDRVLDYVKVAVDEGAEVLTGGKPPDDPALAAGCYVEPTVVRADPGSRVCQEEVFGPFVTVSTFSGDDEAIALANGTEYGLGAGLWTRDLARAHRMARAFRAGMVWVNSYKRVSPGSPFGGVGRSGYGREMGFEAMHEYTEPKSVWVNVDAELPVWYPRPRPAPGDG
jgi:acyl-CoA reductase-like NAD-dependent aldehyde dehydrogenase